jgi:hypothetical protein
MINRPISIRNKRAISGLRSGQSAAPTSCSRRFRVPLAVTRWPATSTSASPVSAKNSDTPAQRAALLCRHAAFAEAAAEVRNRQGAALGTTIAAVRGVILRRFVRTGATARIHDECRTITRRGVDTKKNGANDPRRTWYASARCDAATAVCHASVDRKHHENPGRSRRVSRSLSIITQSSTSLSRRGQSISRCIAKDGSSCIPVRTLQWPIGRSSWDRQFGACRAGRRRCGRHA